MGNCICSSTRRDCFDIHPGNRVAITVNDLDYMPANAPSGACGFGFDITQGLMLVTTDLGNPDDPSRGECNSALVAIEPFAAWTWTATGTSPGGSEPTVLTGYFKATNGTCIGNTSMRVASQSGQPFGSLDAGQGPNVVMERTFTAQGDGGAGCPSICSDSFVVTLKRL